MNVLRWTLDLFAVIAFGVAVAGGILSVGIPWTPVRIAAALLLVLVVPGYALVSALFPERGGLDTLERVVLSVALSLLVVSLVAYAANFTPYGIRLEPILIATVGWSVGFALVGLLRRARLAPEQRYRVGWIGGVRTLPALFAVRSRGIRTQRGPFEPETERQLLLNVLLVASVFALVVAGAYMAVAAPSLPDEEPHTELYLLTENDDGELTAEDLPTELSVGSTEPIHVGIENHEGDRETYTTVVLQQEVSLSDDGREVESVESEEELDTFETTVEDGETERIEYGLTPTESGDVHVWFLLYQGDVPDDPSPENADLSTRLSVTVS